VRFFFLRGASTFVSDALLPQDFRRPLSRFPLKRTTFSSSWTRPFSCGCGAPRKVLTFFFLRVPTGRELFREAKEDVASLLFRLSPEVFCRPTITFPPMISVIGSYLSLSCPGEMTSILPEMLFPFFLPCHAVFCPPLAPWRRFPRRSLSFHLCF